MFLLLYFKLLNIYHKYYFEINNYTYYKNEMFISDNRYDIVIDLFKDYDISIKNIAMIIITYHKYLNYFNN